jgi:hypothetical protein
VVSVVSYFFAFLAPTTWSTKKTLHKKVFEQYPPIPISLSNDYLGLSTAKFTNAIEICNELTRMDTLEWTWKEHLGNLPEMNPRMCHSVNTNDKGLKTNVVQMVRLSPLL